MACVICTLWLLLKKNSPSPVELRLVGQGEGKEIGGQGKVVGGQGKEMGGKGEENREGRAG